MKVKVLEILKPKAKDFGFTIKEIESAAEAIASNLTISAEASEEEQTEAITKAVDQALPFLKLAQSATSRSIEAYKQKNPPQEPPKPQEPPTPPTPPTEQPNNGNGEELLKKMQEMLKANMEESNKALKSATEEINNLKKELGKFKSNRTKETRSSRLEEVLKDTGTFGKRVRKNYERMTFETDEDFDKFIAETKEDLKEYNQERANIGLTNLGNPPGGGTPEVKEMSETEIDALVDSVNIL